MTEMNTTVSGKANLVGFGWGQPKLQNLVVADAGVNPSVEQVHD
jgi:hypothetical protein